MTGALRPVVDAFQKKYPYIKVEIWRANGATLTQRVFEEYEASKRIADVIGISTFDQMLFEERGILQPFYSPNLAYLGEGAIRKAPGGGVFGANTYENGYGLAYNTKLITREEVPKTYKDLLDPKWKDKMVITGDNMAMKWMGTILTFYGEDFVKKLAEQKFVVQMVSARALLDMIINGEYAFTVATPDSQVTKSKQEGAPVDWIPLEPVYVAAGGITLPKHSHHLHAALLFIDFDLSKEAGEIYKATGYNSPRKDLFGLRTYKKFYGPESTNEYLKWNELFNRLFSKK